MQKYVMLDKILILIMQKYLLTDKIFYFIYEKIDVVFYQLKI